MGRMIASIGLLFALSACVTGERMQSVREWFSKTAYGKTPKESLPDLAPYTTFDYFSFEAPRPLWPAKVEGSLAKKGEM